MTCWTVDEHHARDRIGFGTRVVDIGASTGEFAVPARNAGADVLCIELLAENVEELVSQGLDVIRAAAGPKLGRARLIETGPAERRTGCHAEPDDDGDIPMVPLSWIVEVAGGHVDVLKVDIEGGEYALFHGADRAAMEAIDYLAVEFHEWTVPGETRVEGLGERAGAPYEPDSVLRLFAKLSETHDVAIDGDGGGLIWGARR